MNDDLTLVGISSSCRSIYVFEDIRRMLGDSIHPPFMGMVDGMHPKRLLGQSPERLKETAGLDRTT